MAIEDGEITDPNLIRKIEEFQKSITSRDFILRDTSKEDIENATELLDKILGER